MIDPAAMTPYYDIQLTAALRAVGVNVRLLSSRFLYEDVPLSNEYVDPFFFRPLAPRAAILRSRPLLRQVSRLAIYPFDLRRLWQAFKKHPPDLLHIQWTWLPRIDRHVFKRLADRAPCVLTIHDPAPHQQAWAHVTDMFPLLGLADHVIVHAEDNRRQLLERRPSLESRVSVVPHGPLFTEQALLSQEEARAYLELEPQAGIILFFGLIKPYKGLVDLIQAVAEIQSRNPQLRLVIAGQVSGSEKPYVEAIREHGLQDITSLHLRFIPSDLVPYYFVASDLVCLPYWQATQSGVLMAAYRFGRPVVVTDVGGLPETVEDGGNGYVVPAHNPRSLAQALERLLADPHLRRRFGERSRELAETRFGWTNAARLTQAIYNHLTSQT